ncbi:hypothetical protein GYY_01850 [Methanococcus maripaludis X1]|uniref:Uncharacterized protein n=1 Tax=Methanococcus maripaludis X1 TaxID=1053692 RepID=G0H2Q8_METMI|nr:hypothetical protein [Methanococcus maripaludis]AEK19257.1 hypothetical protein GYY_01850 [Methanococcus maripaludis X1]
MLKKILMIFSLLFIISSVNAVSNVAVSPENPEVGDTIILTGKTNPNEEVSCSAWFEINPIISQPYYGALLYDVSIPEPPNNFKVTASNVQNLDVSIKMGVWVTISDDADSSGNAVVSKSKVPEGVYDIKIGGKIKDTSKPVTLKVYASTKIKADENGNFEYQYNTDAIEEGTTIYLTIGGVSKEVTVQGSTPAPVVTPVTNTTTEDTTPPTIKVLAPSKSEYGVNSVNFNIAVTDDSDFDFKIYLNDNEQTYGQNGNYFTGSIYLSEGKNELKIVAEDEYDNKNTKIVYLTYSEDFVENSDSNEIEGTDDLETSENSNEDVSTEEYKNIVVGTMIFNVGNALLTANDGTEISTSGDLEIEEIKIPETALAYVIYPENSEFSIPLTLEIDVSNLSGNLKAMYYDSEKGWINKNYVLKDGVMNINVTNSGYYAIKETETVEENESVIDTIKNFFNAVKIIINAILDRI